MLYLNTKQYCSAIKDNVIMAFAATWMHLGIVILNEVSQKKKDKYNIASFVCEI